MRLYRDYKKEWERQVQEASDRKTMGLDDHVVIIYEREKGYFTRAKSILFLILLFIVFGVIAVFLSEYLLKLT